MHETDDIRIYPIIIHDDTETLKNMPYLIEIPDLNGMTEGYSITNAIAMAKDYIGTVSLTKKLPPSNLQLPKVSDPKAIVTLVDVNISKYHRIYKNDKRVKKSVTIPSYLNELAKEQNINFSQVLTSALKTMLNIPKEGN